MLQILRDVCDARRAERHKPGGGGPAAAIAGSAAVMPTPNTANEPPRVAEKVLNDLVTRFAHASAR